MIYKVSEEQSIRIGSIQSIELTNFCYNTSTGESYHCGINVSLNSVVLSLCVNNDNIHKVYKEILELMESESKGEL